MAKKNEGRATQSLGQEAIADAAERWAVSVDELQHAARPWGNFAMGLVTGIALHYDCIPPRETLELAAQAQNLEAAKILARVYERTLRREGGENGETDDGPPHINSQVSPR